MNSTGSEPHVSGMERALTRREAEIARMVAEGKTTREIASALHRSPKTISHHVQSMYRKLGVRNRVEFVNAARERGLLGAARASRDRIEPPISIGVMRRINALLATASDDTYFGVLVSSLAEALGMRYGGISEVEPHSSRLRVIVMTDGGRACPQASRRLSGSPCDVTLNRGRFEMFSGLLGEYPDDPVLRDTGAQAYAGLSLVDRALGPVGTLWVMHDAPIDPTPAPIELLGLFGPRTASELAVQKMLDDLHELKNWRL